VHSTYQNEWHTLGNTSDFFVAFITEMGNVGDVANVIVTSFLLFSFDLWSH
jgi:hypothetical protein